MNLKTHNSPVLDLTEAYQAIYASAWGGVAQDVKSVTLDRPTIETNRNGDRVLVYPVAIVVQEDGPLGDIDLVQLTGHVIPTAKERLKTGIEWV